MDPIDTATKVALQQLDQIINEHAPMALKAEARERFVTRARAVIHRLTPANSVYRQQSKTDNEFSLLGVVKALRDDFAFGYMKSFRQMINAEMFSDFLEMAEYLLNEEGLKQPAAVLAGGVLEEHIRKLCELHNLDLDTSDHRPQKLDKLNSDLVKKGVYSKNEQKQITAWCGIRNSAAHAKYDEFDDDQVKMMIEGIRWFISRFPA